LRLRRTGDLRGSGGISTFHFLTAMQPGFRTPLQVCALSGQLKRGSKIETSIFKIGTLFSLAAAGKIGVGYK
jgi:hypothetical protein